jgi:hypothetical protein
VRPRWQFVADLRARRNVTIMPGVTVEELHPDGGLVRRAGEDVKLYDLDLVELAAAAATGERLVSLTLDRAC